MEKEYEIKMKIGMITKQKELRKEKSEIIVEGNLKEKNK